MDTAPLASEPPDAPKPRYLRRPAAEAYCALPAGTLAKLASFGTGPRLVKLGRLVRYDVADLDRWMAAQKIAPGPATGTGSFVLFLLAVRTKDTATANPIRAIARWLLALGGAAFGAAKGIGNWRTRQDSNL